MFSRGLWAQAILSIIAAIIFIALLLSLITRLSSVISDFLKGLLARDTTLRFDIARRDPILRDLSEDMNAVAVIYHQSNSQLETSKLYYDRILKIMTHEMRNYVSPMLSLTSDVKSHPDRYSTIESLHEIIDLINSQSFGIRRFLDSYYRLTHLPPLRVENIQADKFITRLIPLVAGEIKSRNLPEPVCTYEVPQNMTMAVDITLMTQVMLNLIRNSLDAVMTAETPAVSIKVSISEGNPYITVTDNGTGISPKIMDNLFQPFYTTKPSGAGIGLALSRQIIRCHNGDLTLLRSSHPTIFAITLPATY